MPFCLDNIRQNPGLVSIDAGGITMTDAYRGGAVLVKFLYDTFGRQKVMDLLASSQASFGLALTDSLGVTLEQLGVLWAAWLTGL